MCSEYRQIADDWLEAFRKKDLTILKLADDFVHTSPFGEIEGKQAYLDLVRENAEAFFAKAINVVDVIDGGDRFAVRYVVGDMAACDCIYVQNGQISRIYSYYHFGEMPVM